MGFGSDGTGFVGPQLLPARKPKARRGGKGAGGKKRRGYASEGADSDSGSGDEYSSDDARGQSKRGKFAGALEYGETSSSRRDPTVHEPVETRSRWVPDRNRHLPRGALEMMGGLLSTAQFTTLDSATLRLCAQVYDTDALVKNVTNVMRNSILGGGIDIQRPGFFLTSAARAFYQRVWSEFVTRVLRSLWAFGLAAVVTEPHPLYKAIPHVLELDRLTVRMQGDIYGLRRYVFHVPETETLLGIGIAGNHLPQPHAEVQEAVPNVLVFELDPPSREGHIQSRVASLLPELRYFAALREADLRAVDSLTNPFLVAKQVTEKYNPKNVAMGASSRMAGSTISLEQAAREIQTHALTAGGTTKPLVVQAVGGSAPPPPPPLTAPWTAAAAAGVAPQTLSRAELAQRKQTLMQRDLMNGRIPRSLWNRTLELVPVQELREGLDAVAPPQAAEPQYLTEGRIGLEELVGAAFGVPRSLFSRYSGSNRGGEDANRLVFLESSRSLKNALLPILTTTFAAIYAADFRDDSLVVALSDNIDLNDAVAVTQVSWILPGVPPPAVVSELWREGTLKREAYVNFLSHLYGMPISAFESSPKLSIKELAGIPPPEPAAAPAAGAKKKSSGGKQKGGAGLKPPGKRAVRAPNLKVDAEALNRLTNGGVADGAGGRSEP